MQRIIFIILFSSWVLNSYGQQVVTIQNPSFEGTPQVGFPPPGWIICSQTPDTQPGFFCIDLPPFDGNSYLGLDYGGGALKQ
jgi:hypothetical protein